jgi:hypothetical protein
MTITTITITTIIMNKRKKREYNRIDKKVIKK